MGRLLAIMAAVFGLGVTTLVAQPTAGPVTLPTTEPMTAATSPVTTTTSPATTTAPATSQASTRPTTATSQAAREQRRLQREAERKEEAKRKEEEGRLAALLTSIPADAEVAMSDINTVTSKFASDPITATVEGSLPPLLGEIGPRLEENERLLSPAPSLDTLRSLETDWTQYARTLDEWADVLKQRVEFLKSGIAKIEPIVQEWRNRRHITRELAESQGTISQFNPDAIVQLGERSKTIRDRGRALLEQLNKELAQANNLIVTISAAKVRVRDALNAVQDAQRKAQDRLLVQDSPPLWSNEVYSAVQSNVAEQGRDTITNQWKVLTNYVSRHRPNFLLHLAGVMALAAALIWLRRQTRQWIGNDPTLAAATRVFETPIATAITVSMILTPWIYPGAPRLFWGILGTAALLPTVMVLRPLIERPLRPLLYGLIGASFVNLLLAVVAALPLVYRMLFLAEMAGAALFFIWFLRRGRGVPGNPARPPLRRAAVIGVRFGLAVTVFAFAANVFGFVSLSRLMGSALLTSAYLGVLLDTSVHVIDALLLGASHIRPLGSLGMVQRHRPLLLKRLHWLLSLAAVFLWGYFTLDALSIRPAVVHQAKAVWAFPKGVDEVFGTTVSRRAAVLERQGVVDTDTDATTQPVDGDVRPATPTLPASVDGAASPADDTLTNSIYVGGLLSFALTLAAAYYLSRFIAFLLDEDVYPRLHLARGMPYAISTLLRYVVLTIGFALAIAKLGYNDMTKLTILVSAFGVGLGFGMQNIVNNFVSGLILLFERPVQVGDVIELDNVTGVVSRIGIRASVIRTPLAAEIIVPNGRLISDRVVNWTLSNRQRGVEIPLIVEAGTIEPQKLIQLLAATAKAHPLVAAYPAPQAYFTDFSGGGLKFEVRAWTNRFEDWTQVRSELAVAINAMLLKENIKLK